MTSANKRLSLVPATPLHKLAHDLRSQVFLARGYAELLAEGTTEPLSRYCTMILLACDRMKQLLDVDKLTDEITATRPLPPTAICPATLLRQCLALHRERARSKSIELRLQLDSPLPQWQVDAVAVNRIVDNLLSNAIKFSPPGSTVTVRADFDGEEITVRVSDQGPGIPENELPLDFEHAGPGSARPTAGEQGTGLGLSIVGQLVRQLGGAVTAENCPFQGATFTVRLPLFPPARQSASRELAPAEYAAP